MDDAVIAWWGAGLSTLLGCLTIYDRFFGKPVPVVSYNLTSSEEVGHELLIANPTSTPIMIDHWRLAWAKPSGFRLRIVEEITEPAHDELWVKVIGPYDVMSLTFAEENYFRSRPSHAKNAHMYLGLRVLGRRRPIYLHVYSPDEEQSYREPWSPRRLLPHGLRPKMKHLS